jgi:hypothetical protein
MAPTKVEFDDFSLVYDDKFSAQHERLDPGVIDSV